VLLEKLDETRKVGGLYVVRLPDQFPGIFSRSGHRRDNGCRARKQHEAETQQ
jgi:hypothetical protein